MRVHTSSAFNGTIDLYPTYGPALEEYALASAYMTGAMREFVDRFDGKYYPELIGDENEDHSSSAG